MIEDLATHHRAKINYVHPNPKPHTIEHRLQHRRPIQPTSPSHSPFPPGQPPVEAFTEQPKLLLQTWEQRGYSQKRHPSPAYIMRQDKQTKLQHTLKRVISIDINVILGHLNFEQFQFFSLFLFYFILKHIVLLALLFTALEQICVYMFIDPTLVGTGANRPTTDLCS